VYGSCYKTVFGNIQKYILVQVKVSTLRYTIVEITFSKQEGLHPTKIISHSEPLLYRIFIIAGSQDPEFHFPPVSAQYIGSSRT